MFLVKKIALSAAMFLYLPKFSQMMLLDHQTISWNGASKVFTISWNRIQFAKKRLTYLKFNVWVKYTQHSSQQYGQISNVTWTMEPIFSILARSIPLHFEFFTDLWSTHFLYLKLYCREQTKELSSKVIKK